MSAQNSAMESYIPDRDFSARVTLAKVFFYAFLILLTIIVLIPVLWLALASLRLEESWQAYPIVIFPEEPQWINYVTALDPEYKFMKLAGNTLKIAIPSAILTTFSSAMSGYAFARLKAKGKGILFVLVLSMLMVPRMVTQIPNFMLFSRLGLTDSYIPWYLWGLAGASYNIFLFRQFFAGIPKDLEDAATVDGCGWFRTFWQIFLPISGSVIATVLIFHFQWVWGDWFTPQIFLSADKTTLGVAVARYYVNPNGQAIYTLQTAATLLYMMPMLIVFLFAQRYIVQGIATTGLKG